MLNAPDGAPFAGTRFRNPPPRRAEASVTSGEIREFCALVVHLALFAPLIHDEKQAVTCRNMGGRCRTRTCDPRRVKAVLYQLSQSPGDEQK